MGGRCDLRGKILRDETVNKTEGGGNTKAVLGRMNWNFSRKRYQKFQRIILRTKCKHREFQTGFG